MHDVCKWLTGTKHLRCVSISQGLGVLYLTQILATGWIPSWIGQCKVIHGRRTCNLLFLGMDLTYCVPSLYIPAKIVVATSGGSGRHDEKARYVHYAELMWPSSSRWRFAATVFAPVLLRDDATGVHARASPVGKQDFLLCFISWSTNWMTTSCVGVQYSATVSITVNTDFVIHGWTISFATTFDQSLSINECARSKLPTMLY